MGLKTTFKNGKRPPPELDKDDMQQRNKVRRGDSSTLSTQDDIPEMIQSSGNGNHLPAIDWNNGDNPLDAWLSQSAIPVASPVAEEVEPFLLASKDLGRQIEEQEIGFYRRVHISDETLPENTEPNSVDIKEQDELPFGAQIYFRNIIDKFPSIPSYLASRFARANLRRAERLKKQRDNAMANQATSSSYSPSVEPTINSDCAPARLVAARAVESQRAESLGMGRSVKSCRSCHILKVRCFV